MQDRSYRSQGRWSDVGTWSGDGIRREVFFFRSGGTELYASLCAAERPSRPFGLVACNSWGVEADRCEPLLRSVALAMARLGGAGLVFHYPGHGDSFGDLGGLNLDDLGQAASDTVDEVSRRCPGLTWLLAGCAVGASVACVAQQVAGVERLLLIQPALRPGAYFQWLSTTSTPLAPGPAARETMGAGHVPGMAYGYPIPGRIVAHAAEADGAVASALARFEGEGVVIRQATREQPEPVPERFQQVDVPGTWRFGVQNHPQLTAATVDWLDRHTAEAAR